MRGFGALAALAGALTLGASAPPTGVDLPLLLADAPAKTLADYHLFEGPGPTKPAAGVTPYSLNTPLFSDYATKARFVYMPPGTHAGYTKTGVFDFPVGTTLIKTFAFPADMRKPAENVRVIETRLLIRKAGGWVANTYVWNAETTTATLTRAGATVPVSFVDPSGHPRQINYAIPNVNQCKECHSLDGAVSPIGPKARNLNGNFTYASGAENQLAYWSQHGLLTGAPAPAQAPRTAVWNDPHEPIADRGRAYLDANCGHCHNPAGFASNSGLYLDLEEQDPSAQGIDKRPIAAGRGSGGLLFAIAPGDPDHSILVYRMASTEPGVMMPQLGRSITHDEGLAVVRAYVAAMKPGK